LLPISIHKETVEIDDNDEDYMDTSEDQTQDEINNVHKSSH
jgi:hypothetical protein